MFFDKEKSAPAETFSGAYCTISNSTVINGSFESESDVRIDGVINGPVKSKGRVVLGEKGLIVGNLTCANGDLAGQVRGKVIVFNDLVVRQSAVLECDIQTKAIQIELGATFNGRCSMSTVIEPEEDEKEK